MPDNSLAVLVSHSTSLQRYAHVARVLAAHENRAGHSESAGVEESEITIVVEQQMGKLVCIRQVGNLSMHPLVYGWGDSKCFVQRDYYQAQSNRGPIWIYRELETGDWYIHGIF